MKMCALSNAIREKPNWWEKIEDPALVEKWVQETLYRQGTQYPIRQLTEKMVTRYKQFLEWCGINLVCRSTMCSKSCMATRPSETLILG